MHEKLSTSWLTFTVMFVVIKQVSTNLTGFRIACICEEMVNDGTTTECAVENRSVRGDLLLDRVGSDRYYYQVENK